MFESAQSNYIIGKSTPAKVFVLDYDPVVIAIFYFGFKQPRPARVVWYDYGDKFAQLNKTPSNWRLNKTKLLERNKRRNVRGTEFQNHLA